MTLNLSNPPLSKPIIEQHAQAIKDLEEDRDLMAGMLRLQSSDIRELQRIIDEMRVRPPAVTRTQEISLMEKDKQMKSDTAKTNPYNAAQLTEAIQQLTSRIEDISFCLKDFSGTLVSMNSDTVELRNKHNMLVEQLLLKGHIT